MPSTPLQIFTLAHVAISLIGIFAGLVVALGMLQHRPLNGWTCLFLTTTFLTSATGFFFPFHGFKPSYVVGAISIVVLLFCYIARYRKHMAGRWRIVYTVTAMLALYLNVFVLIVQSFLKIPALHTLAPTQSEPPFAIAQLTVLLLFIIFSIAAAVRFHPATTGAR